jgi:hypothetical protein
MADRELTEAEKKIVAETVAIGLKMQHRFRPEPLYKLTGKGYMESEGVEGMARVKEEAARAKGVARKS